MRRPRPQEEIIVLLKSEGQKGREEAYRITERERKRKRKRHELSC